jgi:hypothetical protein
VWKGLRSKEDSHGEEGKEDSKRQKETLTNASKNEYKT